jgi:O-antigen/teichoic acid export membrane protein
MLDGSATDFKQLAPVFPGTDPAERGMERAKPGLSLRSNFAWMLCGNVVYAACQWGTIVAVAKMGSSFVVGQFSLGLAVAGPVFMLTNLHLRAVQATDARQMYSFGEYLRLRLGLTSLGLLAILGIARFGHYERQTAFVILAVALAKAIETLSDIHYGLFQLNDRLDQTGRSMMLRGSLSVLAVAIGLYLTRSLLCSCVGLALAWLAVLVLFDAPRRRGLMAPQRSNQPTRPRRFLDLIRIALPLGLSTTMAALNLNMPRYFIDAHLGERQLGVYSALAWSTAAMVLVSDSMGHSAIPRLSRLFSSDRLNEYRSLLFRLVAAGALFGAAGLVVGLCFGERLLMLLYGAEYAAHYRVLWLLILATAIYGVACMFTSAVTAARRFRIQVPLYAMIVGANGIGCALWVPKAGLAGGAAALVLSASVHLALGAGVVFSLLWSSSRPQA